MGKGSKTTQLPPRQRAVWEAFRELAARHGYPPSVRELAAGFKISAPVTWRHLSHLVRRGLLERHGGRFRLAGAPAARLVPVLGRVTAGLPAEPLAAAEGWLPCPPEWASSGRELFALRVRGDSMTGAGIADGDLVVCVKAETAREGQIVVGLVEGEATVKRLGRHDGRPALLPANPRYRPLPLGEHGRVLARVLGAFRNLT